MYSANICDERYNFVYKHLRYICLIIKLFVEIIYFPQQRFM
jgi:hypothetical protein